jgi:hypothetical protein
MKLSHLLISVLSIQVFMTAMPLDRSIALRSSETSQSVSSVTIDTKTVRWKPKRNNGSPNREVMIRYPIVTDLKDPVVAKKIQTAISLKAIVGQSLTELQQDRSPWLTDLGYAINYNQHNVLALTYTISGMGAYPTTSKKRVSLDLKTGNILRSRDLFKPDLNLALAQSIDKMMQREIQAKKIEIRKDMPDLEANMFAKHRFKPKDLNDFTITKKGVTFHYNFDFVHAIKAAEPSGAYFISYGDLSRYIRPDGAIGFALGRSSK